MLHKNPVKFLIKKPISSIEKGTKVLLADGYYTFDNFFMPENVFERDVMKFVYVKFYEILEPVRYHQKIHPTLATIMDKIHDEDNSNIQIDFRLDCIVEFDTLPSTIPSYLTDSCGRMLTPIEGR